MDEIVNMPEDMRAEKKDYMYISIDLTGEQSRWITEKNKELGKVLDRNCWGEDVDCDCPDNSVFHYDTNTYEDYASFIEIINMIANRCD